MHEENSDDELLEELARMFQMDWNNPQVRHAMRAAHQAGMNVGRAQVLSAQPG